MDQGFLNLGRFSGYYHSLFDEYPSETLAGFRYSNAWEELHLEARGQYYGRDQK